ncbi:MAG: hypothetical protein AAGF12_42520 [Myxococcota bacterium]
MLNFPCAACGTPCRLTEVKAWVLADPACSTACSATLSARPTPSSDRSFHFRQALAALTRIEPVLKGALENARSAHYDAQRVKAAQKIPSLSLTGAAFGTARGVAGAVAEARLTESMDWLTTLLWDVEQDIVTCVRHMMALEGLGVPVAAELRPLVSDFAVLSNAVNLLAPEDCWRDLMRLYEYLSYLHAGLTQMAASRS